MNIQTTVSAKGQIVIPKDVRDRLRLAPGERLDIIERPDGVFLRKLERKSGESFDEITARIRSRINYKGPRYTDAEGKAAIDEMFRQGISVTAR